MNRLAAIFLMVLIPLSALGEVRIYLLPEVELSGNEVRLGDIAKIEGAEPGKIRELMLPESIYRDTLVDRKEINDFLSGRIPESFFIFGNGVKTHFLLPEKTVIEDEKILLVKKGQSVNLTVRKGPIIIEISGKALGDGYENDDVEIRIKNGRIIKGRALSEGKVAATL